MGEKEQGEHTRLIERSIEGDESSFQELAHLYMGYIMVFCRNMTKDNQVAEIAAQEVLINMWQSIGSLGSPFAFTAWLRRLMLRVCIDAGAREARGAAVAETLEDAECLPETDVRQSPESYVEERDENERLYALIRKLPEMQRRSLYLHYYENRSYKEIADLLGLTTSTVGTNIRNAKINLRKMLTAQNKDMNMLSGAAIADAFRQDAEAYLADPGVQQFMAKLASSPRSAADRLARTQKTTKRSSSTGQSGGIRAVIALGIVVALAITGLFSLFPMPERGGPADLGQQPISAEPKSPSSPEGSSLAGEPEAPLLAEIVFFSDSDLDETIRPFRAELRLSEDRHAQWRIVPFAESETNDTDMIATGALAEGDGLSADIPGDLAPGSYEIIWVVGDANSSVVSRAFTV